MALFRHLLLVAAIHRAYGATTSVAAAAANNVQLFIDNMDPNAGWAASIQNACSGSTTYAISCTSAPLNNACNPKTATITAGTDFYVATTPAIYSETSATVTESCALVTASSSASCMAIIVAGGYGSNITTTVNYNLTGTEYYQYNVQVTAGASYTDNGGACLLHGSSGASYSHSFPGILVAGAAISATLVGLLVL